MGNRTGLKRNVAVGVLAATLLPRLVAAQTTEQFSPPAKVTKTAPKRLPDEGLRRAQQAEKQLAANQPDAAIQTLTQIDKDFPGHAAVSLRLAQIYDKTDQSGAALFYFRRYLALAGAKAREEATARVFALEMMPDAKQGAQEFGQKLGETTRAAATPTPATEWQIAAAREDGSLVPIRNEKELERLAKQGKLPEATPVASPAGPTPIVLSFPKHTPPTEPTATEPGSEPAPAPEQQIGAMATPAPTAPRAAVSSVYAEGAPAGRDADAALAQAFARGQDVTQTPEPAPAPTLTPLPSMPSRTPPPSLSQGLPISQPMTQPTYRPQQQTRPPAPRKTAEIGAMAFTGATPVTEVVSPRAARFFTTRKSDTGKTTIRLVNSLPEAVITFVALPDDDGEPINVILAKDESRTIELEPGDYEVSANVATINYPPLTLLDAKFPYRFEAGTQYTRRFSTDTLEQVR